MTATKHSAGSPVSDRLLVLQFMRLLNLVALLVIPVLAGVEARRAAAVALVYLVVVAAIEVLRRVAPSHSVAIVSWSVLIDGAAVVLGVGVTGGYSSPLLFLVFLDVMAVTLVASYRTGLKLALWCALLLLLLHAAADAGVVDGENVLDDRVAVVERDRVPGVRGLRRAVLGDQRARAPQQSRPPRAAGGTGRRARARDSPGRRARDARSSLVRPPGVHPVRRARALRNRVGRRA